MIKVSPSLLAADFLNMGAEIRRMADAGADFLHFDVMDGSFVPNISFGFPVLEAAAKVGLPMDVHLMIEHPEAYIERFAKVGAKIITIHAEATHHAHRALSMIRASGCLAGVALNPGTSHEALRYLIGEFDLALVMSVNPGYGGQKLIPSSIQKIAAVRAMLNEAGADAMLEVDGGVNEKNAPQLVRAGATVLVAGSAAFTTKDTKAFIDGLHRL